MPSQEPQITDEPGAIRVAAAGLVLAYQVDRSLRMGRKEVVHVSCQTNS